MNIVSLKKLERVIRSAQCSVITLLCLSCIVSVPVCAQEIESVSSEVLRQSGEDAYWEARVICNGGFPEMVIRQKLKQDSWCIDEAQLPCQPTKLKMAKNVCLNISNLSEAKSKPVQSVKTGQQTQQFDRAEALRRAEAEKAARESRIARIKLDQEAKERERLERDRLSLVSVLNEEQLAIQEERILLEQEKQDVAQLEISLESRAMEVGRQLQALDE